MGAQVLTEGDLAQGREKLFSVFFFLKKRLTNTTSALEPTMID